MFSAGISTSKEIFTGDDMVVWVDVLVPRVVATTLEYVADRFGSVEALRHFQSRMMLHGLGSYDFKNVSYWKVCSYKLCLRSSSTPNCTMLS